MIRTIETRELTVAEVRQVFEDMDARKGIHTVDILFPNEIPVKALSLATGLSLDELDGEIPPSEMKRIIDEVKGKNPFFLTALGHLADIGRRITDAVNRP
jgi:hypothetical protein